MLRLTRTDKILIIHTGHMGDVVSGLPVLQFIKSQTTIPVDVFVRKDFQGLFAGETNVNIIANNAELSGQNYDLVLDLDSSHASRKLITTIPAGFKVGRYTNWIKRWRHSGKYKHQVPKNSRGHIVRNYDPILEFLGATTIAAPKLLRIQNAKVAAFLAPLKAKYRQQVAIHLDASNPIRNLPLKLVSEIILALKQQNIATILIGTNTELIQKIQQLTDHYSYFQLFAIAELKALLGNIDLLIACDSGPIHLAAALGVKTIGIYGPTISQEYAPLNPDMVLIEKDFPCRPCNQNQPCPYQRRCLETIEYSAVRQIIHDFLMVDYPDNAVIQDA